MLGKVLQKYNLRTLNTIGSMKTVKAFMYVPPDDSSIEWNILRVLFVKIYKLYHSKFYPLCFIYYHHSHQSSSLNWNYLKKFEE